MSAQYEDTGIITEAGGLWSFVDHTPRTYSIYSKATTRSCKFEWSQEIKRGSIYSGYQQWKCSQSRRSVGQFDLDWRWRTDGRRDVTWESLVNIPVSCSQALSHLIDLFSIFTEGIPDSVKISLEYLALCNEYPGIAPLKGIQTHIRHFIEFQWWE